MEILLKVQKSFNKFRFEFSKSDSINLIKKRGLLLKIELEGTYIETKTTCGPPNNKGYDIAHAAIDSWIKQKQFHIYPKGLPTKLIFDFINTTDTLVLRFKSKVNE